MPKKRPDDDRPAIQLMVQLMGANPSLEERAAAREAAKRLRLPGKLSTNEDTLRKKYRRLRVRGKLPQWPLLTSRSASRRRRIADPAAGDAYTFIGLERHTKLVLAWHLGRRTKWDAHDFMAKLSAATVGRYQLSSDGFNAYPDAVEYNLGDRVDYAQLVKEYGQEGGKEARRYAPPRLISAEKISVSGNPDEDRICTSHVERHNWTLRGHLRRMTRLSNGFSRKRANLRAALALFFAYYNFCRMHKSIRMTPAMAGGITRKVWTMADLLAAAQAAAA